MPGKSSIEFSGFEKLTFFVEISKFSEISKNLKIFEGGAPALRVIRAGTRLTVHRSLQTTETIAKLARLGPADNGKLPPQNDRVNKVLLDDL